MKSSVRILAIVLALAFLLLARTAFQDTPASADHDDHIDLDDGEATFADPLDGTIEANYLGFGDTATKTVYFYIKSDDLGTKVTARTARTGGIQTTADGDETLIGGSQVYTLIGGNTPPSMVSEVGQTNALDPTGTNDALTVSGTLVTAFDAAYCAKRGAITAAYDDNGNLLEAATTTIDVPSAWGLLSTSTPENATPGQCLAPGTGERAVDDRMLVATTTADTDDDGNAITVAGLQRDAARTRLADKALADANMAQVEPAIENNALQYMYKTGNKYVAATSTNPNRRYTNGVGVDAAATPARPRDTVGGANKPLDSVAFKVVDKDGTNDPPTDPDRTTEIPTFQSNKGGGEFRLAYALPDVPTADGGYTAGAREFVVDATFDIVDVYQAADTTASGADYPAYTSGYSRAWVSSGSDSGQWVEISEVAAAVDNDNVDATDSPTTNLFQGWVVITNDTDYENDSTIYAQDGETLTVQVFDEDDNRSSDVIASATALIDDSAPTISDLSPADDSIISDDELRISFSVNDDGAGSDFRNIEDVVTMVQVEKRKDSGDEPRSTGTVCTLASGEDDIDNAGGNASRVGVLVAPANAKFSSRSCGIVKTGNDGKFNLIITVQDLAGNVTKHTTQLTIDTSKPAVTGNPSVGQAWNEDKNEPSDSANSILVEFNESLDVDTVAAADFTVTGYTIDSVEVVGTNDDAVDDPEKEKQHLNKFVVLTLTEDLANNARPSLTVTGVSDVAGNAIQTATRTSDNYIKAAITVVPFSALIAEDGEQAISFTSDEALRSSGRDIRTGVTVKTGTSVNGNTIGLSIKVADDTMAGSGTFKESTFGDSGAYGVMIQAVDVNGNTSRVGAVKVSREDVSDDIPDKGFGKDESVVVTPANWPPADSDLDGDLKDEFKLYVGGADDATHSAATDVDETTGKVTFASVGGTGIADTGRIEIDYSYVTADQVIQVDVDEPTLTSIPADNAETDYAAGAVQFIWSDDDGYAGDSYKTVTLNEASHEGPNGTSTDILDMLTTHDDKTWVYRPAADLALGDNEFTLKATDAAGNSNEVSVTITVIERKPVKINLGPGWNLISLPGMPASADVNDVFSSDTVSVISQYDGRRVSPWTVWTRGSDGSLSSSPAGRTTIDSGLGLWVLSSDGSALEVDIPGTSKDSPAEVPPSIDLIAGWNLVAVILISEDEVGVNEYLPEGVWTRAFRLSNTTGQFESFSPATRGTDGTLDDGVALKAGDALWVYAAKAGVIVPK